MAHVAGGDGMDRPAWLERSRLFRRLFLLRKVFITRRRTPCYGQFGEDVSIVRFFPKGFRGFFVDVGCYHPVKYNNTWLLYRRGWRGVNVDIDAIKVEAFDLVRGGDVNVACAVGEREGEVRYFRKGFYRLTSTVDEQFARGRPGYVERATVSRRLTAILDGTRFRDRKIDFLSVDAEGHDLSVLRSLDFDRYQPYLVAFELHCRTLEEVVREEAYRLLADRGYSMVGWCGLTVLMENRSFRRFEPDG